MGMYDSIYILNGDAPKCAAGHVQRDELQTKDLDCNLDVFRVFDGRVFASLRHDRGYGEELSPRIDGDSLIVVTRATYPAHKLSGSIVAYTHCNDCDPVVSERATDSWGGSTSETQPWCEWELLFADGVLRGIKPIELKTRDDVRRELVTIGGATVLPDDDRVARKVIEAHRQRTGKHSQE